MTQKNICPKIISSATAGRGIGSVMNIIVAMIDIAKTIIPSGDKPFGAGASISTPNKKS